MAPLPKPARVQARLKVARDHVEDPVEGWENTMWSEETKMDWRGKIAALHLNNTVATAKPGRGDIMLRGCFPTEGITELHQGNHERGPCAVGFWANTSFWH